MTPDDCETDELCLTDGERTWEPEGLREVTTADETDPAWLQKHAFWNSRRDS